VRGFQPYGRLIGRSYEMATRTTRVAAGAGARKLSMSDRRLGRLAGPDKAVVRAELLSFTLPTGVLALRVLMLVAPDSVVLHAWRTSWGRYRLSDEAFLLSVFQLHLRAQGVKLWPPVR
jgi:hypothetical protein